MIVVDSSVWVDYFSRSRPAPETEALDQTLGREPILAGDLIVAEVLQGFRTQAQYDEAEELFSTLEYKDMVGWLVAHKSAENFRSLRRRGVTIRKTVDCLIATFCLENDYPLLHCDSDFKPFEQFLGLQNALDVR